MTFSSSAIVIGAATTTTTAPINHLFLLHPPDLPQPIMFKIAIPHSYPSGGQPPEVISLSVEGRRKAAHRHSQEHGEEEIWLGQARDVMQSVYDQNGREAVCLYEFIEGMKEVLTPLCPLEPEPELPGAEGGGGYYSYGDNAEAPQSEPHQEEEGWAVADPVMEKKSVFTAHACRVTSPSAAVPLVQRLVRGNKRLQRATHNIYAYRISMPGPPAIIYQDNEDDGEAAAGARVAHLLAVMGVVDVLVVVSRWYGGIKLGGDRFRIIGSVAREAVVRLLGEEKGVGSVGSGSGGGGAGGKGGGAADRPKDKDKDKDRDRDRDRDKDRDRDSKGKGKKAKR